MNNNTNIFMYYCESCKYYQGLDELGQDGECVSCGYLEYLIPVTQKEYEEHMEELEYNNGYFKCLNCGHYQHTTEFGMCEECDYEDLISITKEEFNRHTKSNYD